MGQYLLYRLVGFIAPFIPSRLGYPLTDLMGSLVYFLDRRARRVVLENLTHVLGSQVPAGQLRPIARRVFQNSLKNYYELFHFHRLPDEQLQARLQVVGLEEMERALARGKGLVLATAHLGSPDAFMHVAPLFAYRFTAPAERLQPERLFEYVRRLRQRRGVRLVPVDGPLISIVRALKRNEVVGVAVDRDITGSGIVIDFFGAPARLPDGPVQLALRTGAALAMGLGIRLPDNSFLAKIEPIALERSGDFQWDVRANLAKVVAALEEAIRQHPDQWLMFYPLWRDNSSRG